MLKRLFGRKEKKQPSSHPQLNIPQDLRTILQELDQPTHSLLDMPRRIELCRRALTLFSRADNAPVWGALQNDLANSLAQNPQGARADNLEEALRHSELALEVRTRQAFPVDHQQTSRNLGHLYFAEVAWAGAVEAYQNAIAAEKILLAAAFTREGQQAEVAETAQLYARAAYALLKLNRPAEALAQLERDKTRLLAQAIALNEADDPRLSPAEREQLLTLREARRSLEDEYALPADHSGRRDEQTLKGAMEQTNHQLLSLVEGLRAKYPGFMPEGLSVAELLKLIPSGGVLVAPVITSAGSAVFVIPGGTDAVTLDHVLWLDGFKDADLQTILRAPAKAPEWGGWLGAYFNMRDDWSGWLDGIETALGQLKTALGDPIRDKLKILGITAGSPLILMPQGGLGLLPLHALFLEEYPVTVIPGGYAFSVSRRRAGQPHRQGKALLAVINPTADLPFTPAEGEKLAGLFGQAATLFKVGEATLAAVTAALNGQSTASCNRPTSAPPGW